MARLAQQASRLLVRFGRRYAAAVRLVTLVPICAIALFRSAPENLAPTAAVVAVAVAWTCGYAWWLVSGRGKPSVVLDLVVLLGLSACVLWTGAIEDTNTGWLRLLVLFMCVTCQWHTPVLVGVATALAAGGGTAAAVAAAGADASVIRGLLWAPVAAALSRGAWTLLRRAAHRADLAAAEAARARGQALLAAAVRAEEREFASALHDTAATTLLMVGIGQVRAEAAWLAAQARRDLDRLGSGSSPARAHADVVGLLRAGLEAVPLTVEFDAPKELRLPYDVARAVAGAAGEALTNVRRHADTTRATMRLRGDSRALRLDIADRGRGFSPEEVPATRYGLRESIHGRMTRIGGAAMLTSAPGEGTLVRLEWRAVDS